MRSWNCDLGFELGSLAANDILPMQAATSNLLLTIHLAVIKLNGPKGFGIFPYTIE